MSEQTVVKIDGSDLAGFKILMAKQKGMVVQDKRSNWPSKVSDIVQKTHGNIFWKKDKSPETGANICEWTPRS